MAKTDQLAASVYFSTPVYSIEIPEWVDHVDKVCNKYIKAAKENNKKVIKDREKELGKKVGDVVSISTSDFNYYPWQMYQSSGAMDLASSNMEAKRIATSITPSDQDINAQVTVVFRLK